MQIELFERAKADHVAILGGAGRVSQLIRSRMKTIESRWGINRSVPYGRVFEGDMVYFKDVGKPVTFRAVVRKVEKYADISRVVNGEDIIKKILRNYGHNICMSIEHDYEYLVGKNYCTLIFLGQPEDVKPFNINRNGYGNRTGWIVLQSINDIAKYG